MTRTLIVHIGHFKTGTTAIQTFCQQNRSLLARAGVHYAASQLNNAKHSAFAFALLRAAGAETLLHGYRRETPPEALWEELFAEMRASGAPATLISSEEFMRLAEFPDAVARLKAILAAAGDIRLRVLVWLRAPGAHLDSWYNQLVKMREITPSFASAVTGPVEAIHYDYAHALAPWRDLAGAEAVEIRRYPTDRSRPHVLIEEALGALGVPVPADLEGAAREHNPRLDERVLEAVRLLQNGGFPRHTVENARKQMTTFLLREDALAAEGDGDLGALEARAAAGLAGLSECGRVDFAPEEMETALPRRPLPSAEMLVASFLMSEFVSLRRRVNAAQLSRLDDLAERVARLESERSAAS